MVLTESGDGRSLRAPLAPRRATHDVVGVVRVVGAAVHVVSTLPPHAQLRHVGEGDGDGAGASQACHHLGVFGGDHVLPLHQARGVDHAWNEASKVRLRVEVLGNLEEIRQRPFRRSRQTDR